MGEYFLDLLLRVERRPSLALSGVQEGLWHDSHREWPAIPDSLAMGFGIWLGYSFDTQNDGLSSGMMVTCCLQH